MMMSNIWAARILHWTSKTMLGLFKRSYCFTLRYTFVLKSCYETKIIYLFYLARCSIFFAYSISNARIFNMYGTSCFIESMLGQKPRIKVDFRISKKVFTLNKLDMSSGLKMMLPGSMSFSLSLSFSMLIPFLSLRSYFLSSVSHGNRLIFIMYSVIRSLMTPS